MESVVGSGNLVKCRFQEFWICRKNLKNMKWKAFENSSVLEMLAKTL